MSVEAEIIQAHGGKIVSGFFVAMGTFLMFVSRLLVKREVKHWDDRHMELVAKNASHEARLAALEIDVATRADIKEVYDRVDEVGKRGEERHAQIIELILTHVVKHP